jgi:ribosome-associated protein
LSTKTKTPALGSRKAASLKKAAPKKKVAAKKAVVKKAAIKKAAPKSASKAVSKKSVVKKSAPKKAPSVKAPAGKKTSTKTTTTTMVAGAAMCDFAQRTLDNMKARDIRVLDVRALTGITDFMVIASGTSDRHVRSIAGYLISEAKKAGLQILGSEGERDGEWALVDLGDVIVHVMQATTRDFYNLEKLWSTGPEARETADEAARGT